MQNIPKKPMRPLTAYHIFFQIEREYIIQTLPDAGEESPKSSPNKKVLEDVPDRYKAVKLSPDWYFGPGKRPKRKHRKAHGKVGFMELSRIIASRWAELDTLDPEVKAFVTKLAKQELDEYLADMQEYKELTKCLTNKSTNSTVVSSADTASKKRKSTSTPSKQVQARPMPRRAETPISLHYQPSLDLNNEINNFISRIDNDARHFLQSNPHQINHVPEQQPLPQARRNSLLSFLEPLFDNLEQDGVIQQQQQQQPTKKQRRNSPSSVTVDICDDEIIRMWKEHN
jgi:hypothetical protein